ncbi:MAG: hypothetical protein ACI8W7_004351 [Gammaproteobacteria bacterium]|jgi:hypothetical protein
MTKLDPSRIAKQSFDHGSDNEQLREGWPGARSVKAPSYRDRWTISRVFGTIFESGSGGGRSVARLVRTDATLAPIGRVLRDSSVDRSADCSATDGTLTDLALVRPSSGLVLSTDTSPHRDSAGYANTTERDARLLGLIGAFFAHHHMLDANST